MRSAAFVLAFALGCGAASTPTSPPATGSTSATNGNGTGSGASAVSGGATRTTIAPGFLPSPMLFHGRSGGPVDASTRASGCYGYAPTMPQHTLSVSAPIPNLVVAAHAGGADILLHVLLPDGTWRCNDDWDGLSPRVEGPVGVGRLQIFVGAFVSSAQSASEYVLGVTEDASFYPSTLPWP